MSHPQFHSTNLFILRHAWLNLWDKHMTTGRINQVTTDSVWVVSIKKQHSDYKHQYLGDLMTNPFQVYAFITRKFTSMNPHEWNHSATSESSSPLQVLKINTSQHLDHLIPRSHKFRTRSPCLTDKGHRPQRRLPAIGVALKGAAQSRRIFEWLLA